MSDDELITLKGVVLKRLPNAMFRVRLENDKEIIAHSSGKIRKNHINIVVADEVTIEVSVYDTSKGRIIHRGPMRDKASNPNINPKSKTPSRSGSKSGSRSSSRR